MQKKQKIHIKLCCVDGERERDGNFELQLQIRMRTEKREKTHTGFEGRRKKKSRIAEQKLFSRDLMYVQAIEAGASSLAIACSAA